MLKLSGLAHAALQVGPLLLCTHPSHPLSTPLLSAKMYFRCILYLLAEPQLLVECTCYLGTKMWVYVCPLLLAYQHSQWMKF